ncbi:MFS general substrate transporter [Myriangium duriaei CBS 260.36]|uniref:MFS general substrate transporter n=1 Tax=Myriangium duriaei CBS 260.36 TaxID=1168546 RepID=A0A9P4J8L9_9PEZI|nr:MFS general substrate transporter [Myriangium duriaei CBS 260.36]
MDLSKQQSDKSADDGNHVEKLQREGTHATYIPPDDVLRLSEEHRQYLLQRHGTLELDPIPDYGDADPYNWPKRTKIINLILVAFHAMMATFTASSIQSAFENISMDLHVSLQRTSYLTSLQIAILGGAPLFWRPISTRYGRRPVFLISLLCSLAGNIGCANSHSFATMALCRAITAFFIAPAAAIGSAVVQETFFKRDRGTYMGVWTLMVTVGVPIAPFIFGFVVQRVNYRWVYYILAITNGVQFLLYAVLGPESRYIRKGVAHKGSTFRQEFLQFRRIDPSPIRAVEFIQPLFLGRHPSVLIPACAYSMVFLFASVMITVEVPQLFGQKFQFGPQALGLQFLGVVIGSILGELVTGRTSDYWMRRKQSSLNGGRAPPEHRLWLIYVGYLLAVCGIIVFLVQINNAPPLHWNVTPIVGAAIAAAGSQIVTTIAITYAVDSFPDEAAGVGVFITFVRQIWGFIGPFWFPQMFEEIGLPASAGVAVALIAGVSILPTILLQLLKGRRSSRS